jgi:hypothetical protein
MFMAQVHLPLAPRRGFGETSRPDTWWVQPLLVFLVLSGFIAYASWAGMQNAHYWYGNYLSPLYSPELWGKSPHAVLGGPEPPWWPSFMTGPLAYSPAMLILVAPAGFRVTCYYYRGAYYKAFWLSPPACAVGKPHAGYSGERAFPLLLQNLHRYFMYAAVLYLFILAHDAYKGLWFAKAGTGAEELGLGVGTLVLTLNVVFLGSYTLGCHSFRHVIGGFRDVLTRAPFGKKAYDGATCLNRAHQRWAWTSLVWVGFTDLYVRMCSMGIWTDWRIF